MSRTLWFAAGAGAGIYATARARRAVEALTADGLRDRLGALDVGARLLREEVASGATAKETELRRRLGLVPDGTQALPPGTATSADGTREIDRQEGSS
jgi:hypothetical protein